jgi:hypothetical protein
MLTQWIFVMYITGKEPVVFQAASEADCNKKMIKLLTLQKVLQHEASGACYLRATKD